MQIENCHWIKSKRKKGNGIVACKKNEICSLWQLSKGTNNIPGSETHAQRRWLGNACHAPNSEILHSHIKQREEGELDIMPGEIIICTAYEKSISNWRAAA